MMIITGINYSQNIKLPDEWHLKDVSLGKLNLIVSRNAVGKTRTVNILNALVNLISGRVQIPSDGNWNIEFENNTKRMRYILSIKNRQVEREQFKVNGKVLLDRKGESGFIISVKGGMEVKERYSPPANKLTNLVRRDVDQYPYIEDLVSWAENYHSFTFSIIRPTQYSMPVPRLKDDVRADTTGIFSPDLSTAPQMFEEINDDPDVKRSIIKDLGKVGYEVRDLTPNRGGLLAGIPAISVLEKGVNFPIPQQSISQGMFRVIAIIVTVHYLIAKTRGGTIVIDDLCEGLDFSRSLGLASLLFKKMAKENTQLIVTTNDQSLMNSVDLKYWNIFERRGKFVKSFNYKNNKETFDEFKLTGINNFDFFANKLYKELRRE